MKEKKLNSNKRFISGLSLACSILIISGCSNSNPAVTSSSSSSPNTNFTQNTPAGLTFTKVSDKNAALLNVQPNATSSNATAPTSGAATGSTATTAPQAAPVAGSGAVSTDIASSAKIAAPYYGGYFPYQGPFEQYVMIDFQQATTTGYTGTYLDTYNKIVKPVISAWSDDAVQTSSYGSSDNNGLNQTVGNTTDPNSPNYYSPYQWQYTFSSTSKKEVYSILVSSNQTLILRQKWVLENLNPDTIKIDSNAAIKIYTDKIADKNAKSPDNNDQYQYTPQPNSELLYSIPDNPFWSFYLSEEQSGLVWNINLNFNNVYYGGQPVPLANVSAGTTASPASTPPTPTSMPSFSSPQPVQNISYSGGYAKINAITGEVISFTRPMKYTNIYYPYNNCDSQGNCYASGGGTTGVSVPPALAQASPKPQ